MQQNTSAALKARGSVGGIK